MKKLSYLLAILLALLLGFLSFGYYKSKGDLELDEHENELAG